MARQGQPREPCTLDRKVFRGRVLTASRPAGGAWSKPTVLDSHLAITTQTPVAVNSRGAAVAVAVWAHERLPDSDSYASEVSIDRAGNAVVMYERHRGRGAWARRCDAATGVWTSATRLSLASPAGVGDSLAVSANGGATASLLLYVPSKDLLVWQTARMHPNGTWTRPTPVSVSPPRAPRKGSRSTGTAERSRCGETRTTT